MNLLHAALLILAYMTAWFGVAVWRRDNGLADVAWGLGFAILSLLPWVLHPEQTLPGAYWGLALMVWLWALRLSGHIALRNSRKGGEDFRYKQWRQDWGANWVWRTYLQVFLLQGFFMWVIALPIQTAGIATAETWSGWRWIGVAVFLFGWLWESVADYQLLQFTSDKSNKGKIMTTGLWRYSRHPNYFGECLLWWGIWLYALSFAGAWWSAIGPLTLTWLLLRVSGVPMLEAKYKDNPAYQEYKQRTPAFWPWGKRG